MNALLLASPPASFAGEVRKLAAFLRRDLLIAWNYRFAFFSDIVSLAAQGFVFYFISLMVDPVKMPSFGGTRASYMAFVAVGIALSTFLQIGMGRMAAAVRNEQLMGTLESLLMTPTSELTLQIGWIVYDLVYIPVRTTVFLAIVALAFGVDFSLAGVLPAALVLVLFMPFVWGLGAAMAAAVLAFRRVPGLIGFGASFLGIASGAFFPLSLFPPWLAASARLNPVAMALDAMRGALLSGAGWGSLGSEILLLAPSSLLALVLGLLAFHLALRRERGRGTLGFY